MEDKYKNMKMNICAVTKAIGDWVEEKSTKIYIPYHNKKIKQKRYWLPIN